jgi:hypothetical protein
MIPARGARTACETGINDGGYRVSGCPGGNLHGAVYSPVRNPATVTRPPSELHRCLIGTGLAARVAHLINVGGMATTTGRIGVEPVIQGGDD